jgi:hypothetical protein
MKITLNGVLAEFTPADVNRMLIEVEPGGETIGPVIIELVGGPLRINGSADIAAALTLKVYPQPDGSPSLILNAYERPIK